jgi:hypothetical protein
MDAKYFEQRGENAMKEVEVPPSALKRAFWALVARMEQRDAAEFQDRTTIGAV